MTDIFLIHSNSLEVSLKYLSYFLIIVYLSHLSIILTYIYICCLILNYFIIYIKYFNILLIFYKLIKETIIFKNKDIKLIQHIRL